MADGGELGADGRHRDAVARGDAGPRHLQPAIRDLGGAAAAAKPVNERIDAAKAGADDPALATLYFQFGRYLLLSSSRPGSQPANLQGIWNESMHPPWQSKYTININTEMNYWPAESGNLAECVEPLIEMVIVEAGPDIADNWIAERVTGLDIVVTGDIPLADRFAAAAVFG